MDIWQIFTGHTDANEIRNYTLDPMVRLAA